MAILRILISLAFVLAHVACTNDTQTNPSTVTALANIKFPEKLSELGGFSTTSPPVFQGAITEAYQPNFPLWSNGLDKRRFVAYPDHAPPILNDDGFFSFSVGTLFFKDFLWKGTPIETRIIYLAEDGWKYAHYAWDKDENGQLDGFLMDHAERFDVVLEDADVHSVPNERQCRSCHESNPGFVLGYRKIQLKEDALLHDNEETNFAMGYMVGNCVSCHNGTEWSDNSSFSLEPDVFLENTVDRESQDSASAAGTRIVAGNKEQSVLYQALLGEDEQSGAKAMPPLGIQVKDIKSIERIGAWIDHLD